MPEEQSASAADNYLLGHTPQAIQRLLRLGQIYEQFTRRVFVEAGITSGMTVLDVGCGPGEVSLVAADLVGETGKVLGVDASADMLQVARARAHMAGMAHVSFMDADPAHPGRGSALRRSGRPVHFDAFAGPGSCAAPARPPRASRRDRRLSGIRHVQLRRRLLSALSVVGAGLALVDGRWERAGGNIHAGMQLPALFRAAGLPAPQMRYEASIGADQDWPGFEMRAADVRTFSAAHRPIWPGIRGGD